MTATGVAKYLGPLTLRQVRLDKYMRRDGKYPRVIPRPQPSWQKRVYPRLYLTRLFMDLRNM